MDIKAMPKYKQVEKTSLAEQRGLASTQWKKESVWALEEGAGTLVGLQS